MNDKLWAVVELFGYSKIAGEISDVEVAGVKMLRVDVPVIDGVPAFTKFYGASAIYAITPCSEDVAKRAAQGIQVKPLNIYIGPAEHKVLSSGQDDDSDDDLDGIEGDYDDISHRTPRF